MRRFAPALLGDCGVGYALALPLVASPCSAALYPSLSGDCGEGYALALPLVALPCGRSLSVVAVARPGPVRLSCRCVSWRAAALLALLALKRAFEPLMALTVVRSCSFAGVTFSVRAGVLSLGVLSPAWPEIRSCDFALALAVVVLHWRGGPE